MLRYRIVIVTLFLLSSFYGKAEDGRLDLFRHDMREMYPSVIYDFMERYFFEMDSLAHAGQDVIRKMKDDKVIFVEGSLETMRKISHSNPFTVTRIEDKAYSVTWTDSTQTRNLLTVMFPVSFELILGQPRHKLERTLEKQLREQPATYMPDVLSEDIDLELLDDSCFRRIPVQFSDIASVNDAVYFFRKNMASVPVPVFDDRYRWYSAVNLLQGIISGCDDYRLHILQSVFEFDTLEYTVSLPQWLNYCRSQHMVVHIGLEEEREDGLKLLLLAYSRSLGFEHLLSVVIPWNFIEKKDAVLKARLHAYIPKNNVKTMYQENYSKQRTKKTRKI